MINLKLLNKIILQLVLFFLLSLFALAEENVDIWKSNENQDLEKSDEELIETEISSEDGLFQTIKPKENNILEDSNIKLENEIIYGLFDPQVNSLSTDMWINSDGNEVLEKLKKIEKIKLSKFAENILIKTLFTNSYAPKKNIKENFFFDYKTEWLIKKKKIKLIEEYLIKNENLKKNSSLITFLIDEYLSDLNIEEACNKTKLINKYDSNSYVDKFKIYCLINEKKIDEAQLQFDLLKEIGFEDKFYEKKIKFLLGYSDEKDTDISDKNLINFHLSHRVNSEFSYEPNEKTSKNIWKYLSAANLIFDSKTIDYENEEKINLIEKAVANDSYDEKELFNIYKNILFNINQLLNVESSYKSLPPYKARALLYQSILLTDNVDKKIKLILKLNDEFEKDQISAAFKGEIYSILSEISKDEISNKYKSFYEFYVNKKNNNEIKKIKYNNSILHQSKLLKYFQDEKYTLNNANKDLQNVYKKIKKNKNYYFSTKDIIILESLKNDGLIIPKKIEKLYSLEDLTIPNNLINLVEKKEEGLFLLNLVEIIGEDKLEKLDSETLYFIVILLNQLQLTEIRNDIIINSIPERN